MKIYVRKIDNQCVEKQISILKGIVDEFFQGKLEFIGVDTISKREGLIRILPATDTRFSSADIKAVITGKLEIGDLLVFYENGEKYDVELIKPTDDKYNTIQQLCSRDQRHSLLYVDTTEAIIDLEKIQEKNKEKFKSWLIKNNYSNSTVVQYITQVSLASKESIEKGIIERNLYSIVDIEELNTSVQKIKETNEYNLRKQNSNGVNEAALNLYLNFANDALSNELFDENDRIKGGYNKIYYGVPGCGKSYTVNKEFNNTTYHIERTTFHPEYTNSDFIGQIIPKLINGAVSYEFHPGAFAKSLVYALKNPTEKICLIIEEINRGNASAIFGDIFQLLDRDNDGKSKYDIFNGPLIDYLNKENLFIDKIYIPSNMWIIATMNTCDQNVFTLDTAFKRRWKMEYIKNIFSNNPESTMLKNTKILFDGDYNNITWGEFVTKINKHILSDKSGINGEDKQLGMYFVSIEEINSPKEFAEKILSYLWEDVAKLNPQHWFNGIESYDELLNKYEESYLKVFDSLFDEEIKVTEDISIRTEKIPEGE